MRLLTKLVTILALACGPELSAAQQPKQLTRVLATAGLNDSALVVSQDSASRIRAATLLELKRALARGSRFDSLGPNVLSIGGTTVNGGGTWTSLQTFAANQRVDSATGAARASGLVGSPVITVTSCTGCGGGGTQDSIRLKNGAAATPSLMFANSLTTGLYRFGADTIGVAIAGVNAFEIPSIGKLVGAAGNMTIQAGTGNSRTLTLQTTGTAGVAVNTLVLGADSSATALGKIVPNSVKGIVGTVTNDAANAGSIGEYVSGARATGVSLTLSTGATLTVDSVSLTAGDWDVSGTVSYTYGATTSYTNLTGCVSTTTNVLGAQGSCFDYETAANVPTAGADATWAVPMTRVSLSATTTVFIVAQGTFTVSTLKGYGTIRARRVR